MTEGQPLCGQVYGSVLDRDIDSDERLAGCRTVVTGAGFGIEHRPVTGTDHLALSHGRSDLTPPVQTLVRFMHAEVLPGGDSILGPDEDHFLFAAGGLFHGKQVRAPVWNLGKVHEGRGIVHRAKVRTGSEKASLPWVRGEADTSAFLFRDSAGHWGSRLGPGSVFIVPRRGIHMDGRVRDHAEVLVDWSARVNAGEDVVVSVAEGAHDLAVSTAEVLGERGANLLATYASDEMTRAYLQGRTAADVPLERPDGHALALYEAADVRLRLGGGRNTMALADVPGETRQAYRRANRPVREARMDTDRVSTVHPTRSLAQQAGMAYTQYQEFVYDAVLRDWEALAEEMARLKDVFDEGSEVRIEIQADGQQDGGVTDLRMSIEGRTAVNSAASVAYDSHNLPSGEVFTAPTATTGTVFFDVPMTIDSRRVEDVRLTFEDGTVVDYAAETGEAVLEEVLETDEGAKRLGELGVGMNRGIDRVTNNILFDEKMGGTVHLALGRAYDACLPSGQEGNDSAVHVDMIADMTGESRLVVDGETIQRNGTFRWEEGFEAQ